MDLLSFSALMSQRANNLPMNVNSLTQVVAIQILTNLSEAMPVDTGMAVSNTVVSLGAPNGFLRPPFNPGNKGSTKSENVRATIAAGTNIIKVSVPGQNINITNAIPYVKDLNDGTSKKAPAGFVESAVLQGRQAIIGAKVL